ncbi:hypothetical protein MTQ10_17860 [Streptomyces sp. XM83C]|jgi:hypothetical protein|uniref:AG1 protein n=1 Tax=Streptomyces thermocoprophilus TaxID=78356 RepID=A0ABV5VHZ5_9ACTN|nr:hypothetical protein [Streptomyces sp. XM83C]MCK1821430.1 hypothetical protein [Streptomyces sp. XM83C]
MAWDEWEQLKKEAATRRETAMQIDHVPPEPGEPQGDLKVNQQDLAAVGDSAFKLYTKLAKHGRDAWSPSQSAAQDLTSQGFDLGSGLHRVQERWEKQLQTLLDAVGHISNHMDYTKNAHAGDEHYISGLVSKISVLDQGFTGKADR